MDIRSIAAGNERELELRHLRLFQVLLREHNLTRAAEVLSVTQPALSKTLAGLRAHFADPLFIRVGHRMEPTSKALELEPAIQAIIDRLMNLRTEHVPFDPAVSSRTFCFCVVDAGIIRFLPALLKHLEQHAPRIRLKVVPLDIDRIESSLESGTLDFAMGSYQSLSKRVRRQLLWRVRYVGAARASHPRIGSRPTLAQFAAERHVLVSAAGTGHAHKLAERALEKAVAAENIVCRVPTFATAACVASMTDALVALPEAMAQILRGPLDLQLFDPPLKLPTIDVSQHWHERFHRDLGNRWIRGVFAELFAETRTAGRSRPTEAARR
jgi:DNA-binding transcriptional LysR family regulator